MDDTTRNDPPSTPTGHEDSPFLSDAEIAAAWMGTSDSFSSDNKNENPNQAHSGGVQDAASHTYGGTSSTPWIHNLEEGSEDSEESAIAQVARFNYESYYNLPRGSANLTAIENSSAGLFGWASCVLQSNGTSSSKRQRSEGTKHCQTNSQGEANGRKKACLSDELKPRSDEEEERQLRLALLESLGVKTARAPSESLEQSEITEKYEYDSDGSESTEEHECVSKNHRVSEQEKQNTSQSKGKCTSPTLGKEEEEGESINNKIDEYAGAGIADDDSKCPYSLEGENTPSKILPSEQEKGSSSKGSCEKYFKENKGSDDHSKQTDKKSITSTLDEEDGNVGDDSAGYVDVNICDDSDRTNSFDGDEVPRKILSSEQEEEFSSEDDRNKHSEGKEGFEEDFVVIDSKPKISRTSWQWGTFVKNLEKASSTEADEFDKSSDDCSGEWSLV